MNNLIHNTAEYWEAEEVLLKAWEWDGRAIEEIASRLEMINSICSSKHEEWAQTVPAEYRGLVSYIAWCDPYNSERTITEGFEILACDQSNEALVRRVTVDTYLGAEDELFNMMPMEHANRNFARYVARKNEEELLE